MNEKDLIEEYKNGYATGYEEGLDKRYDYNFIEKVIDAYLLVKHDCQSKDYVDRHDFITMVINKTKSI